MENHRCPNCNSCRIGNMITEAGLITICEKCKRELIPKFRTGDVVGYVSVEPPKRRKEEPCEL